MPEINHKTEVAATVADVVAPGTKLPISPSKPAPDVTTKALADAIANAGVPMSKLEEQIEAILNRKKAEHAEAMRPKEPDWKSLSENEAYAPDVYIPVIEHDIPDYMNIKLKDTEYEPVWASRDQRRVGQLQAEGYEFIKPEHMATDFKLPLLFNSEGMYVYQDVIAMRVHKRILFGKRRRALEISKNQLKRRGADATIKAKLAQLIEGDPSMERAFQKQGLSFFEPSEI